MQHFIKNTLILSTLSIIAAAPAFANSERPDEADNPEQAVHISLESFEEDKVALGLDYVDTADDRTSDFGELEETVFVSDDTIEIEPLYELTDQSVAFVGSTRMSDKGFADYQRSALTPEGRIVEPMQSLASVGIRSKF